PLPPGAELPNGTRVLIQQLIDMLRLEADADPANRRGRMADFSRAANAQTLDEIDAAAAKHGSALLAHGFSVDQVVHDYGDLCQAITELASARKVSISAGNFRTLNRCLDNAIAGAVEEYAHQRDMLIFREDAQAMHERLGHIADDLRAQVECAMLASSAIKSGGVGAAGATGAALDRSLERMRDIIDRSLAEIRLSAGMTTRLERVAVADLISEIRVRSEHEAKARGCTLTVGGVNEDLAVRADRALLSSAVGKLLRSALKHTPPKGEVLLRTRATVTRVGIDIEDQCGGLPPEDGASLEQRAADRRRSDHALEMRAAEAAGGRLRLRNSPGRGCVFTIELPRQC
ncbi:MAG TPA: HAMP domain-containing sensor histidine kinase, partial [Burkholderiales bacterium]|nr:HAMP domain-containing sensor histidine kinase [Burkholderiales bacterium]